jgi:hypothetical protein
LKLPELDFGDWSRRVREALVWLGCDDPGSTMEKAREEDPYRADRAAVFLRWHEVIGESAVLVREIIAAAFGAPDFYAALLTVASARSGKEISPERLGRWLVKNKGSVTCHLTLIRAKGISGGLPRWQIKEGGF